MAEQRSPVTRLIGACLVAPELAERVPLQVMAKLKPFSRAVILAMRQTSDPHVLLDALALAGFDRAKAERWCCRAIDTVPNPLPDWEPKTMDELKRWRADPGGPDAEDVFKYALGALR